MNELILPAGADAITRYRQFIAGIPKLRAGEKRKARRELRRARRTLVEQTIDHSLKAALDPMRADDERLAWFWFNHFNVWWQKKLVGAALPDYLNSVIRPYSHGLFRELLYKVILHPAMLVYLDNTQNKAKKTNENLARELLELHTLGVDAGYTQKDVIEVARILTGLGLRPLKEAVQWRPENGVQDEFYFDNEKHDKASKLVLGHVMDQGGFQEVEALVDLLASHPATAKHITWKLCLYCWGDDPPKGLHEETVHVFTSSNGDISKTIAAIHGYRENNSENRRHTFKDPYRYILSAVTLLAAGKKIIKTEPIAHWLDALGESLYDCRTPNGYSLIGKDWTSAGQLTQRFEMAPQMIDVVPRLLDEPVSPEAVLSHDKSQDLIASFGPASHNALSKAADDEERLALLLSSPEFMYW